VGEQNIAVPSRAVLFDERDGDTLRVELTIEDAIASDTRSQRRETFGAGAGQPSIGETSNPYFIQMKGTARISGRLDGEPVTGTGIGFFETFR
jgi:hypothetical protein